MPKEETKEVYRIYGKHKDDKRFSALGSDGLIGNGNLIYAYFFTIGDVLKDGKVVTKADLDNKVKNLSNDNKDFKFELRKV